MFHRLIGALMALLLSGWATANPLSYPNPVNRPCTADEEVKAAQAVRPQGAIWRTEHHHGRPTVVPGYSAFIGWINVATALPCTTTAPATVEIRAFRIIELAASGKKQLIQQLGGGGRFDSNIFPRCDPNPEATREHPNQCKPKWFGITTGTNEAANVVNTANGVYAINANNASRRNLHAWLEPRQQATPGVRYIIEFEAKIAGQAKLQVGTDWWRDSGARYVGFDETCEDPRSVMKAEHALPGFAGKPANNCENYISSWFGDTGGQWKTFRVPSSYE